MDDDVIIIDDDVIELKFADIHNLLINDNILEQKKVILIGLTEIKENAEIVKKRHEKRISTINKRINNLRSEMRTLKKELDDRLNINLHNAERELSEYINELNEPDEIDE